MSIIDASTPSTECECHMTMLYHSAPKSPTASVEPLFDGSASESHSPLMLALTSGDIDEIVSQVGEEEDSNWQPSHTSSPTGESSESIEDNVVPAQDSSLRHAHRQSTVHADETDAEPGTYDLRALQDVEHGMLLFRDALSQLRIERTDALARLDRTHSRVEAIVKSSELGVCVMLHQPMLDPRRTHCGHYFCFACILKWQKKDDSCPGCGQMVQLNKLRSVEAVGLAPTLQGWKVIERHS